MGKKKRQGGTLGGVAGDVVAQVGPEALLNVLLPTIDEVTKRAHGLMDHAEEASRGVLADAEHRTGRATADIERRVRHATSHAADELRDVGRDLNVHAAERVRDAKKAAESFLDSFMDRILALGLAVAIGYGAYFIAKSKEGHVDVTRLALLTWTGMTFFSIVIGMAWRLTDRPERLRHTLIWFLYIAALGGLGTLVLTLIAKLPVI